MDRLYGWNVAPEMVVTVTGIVSGFSVAIRALCTPKKGYLIQPPVYNEFHAVHDQPGVSPNTRRHWCAVRQGNILHYEIDWDVFEKQVKKARVFLLCNPHNPLGIVYSRQDLRRMAELCLEHDVMIVSDEIHSELLLADQKFSPAGKVIIRDRKVLHNPGFALPRLSMCPGFFVDLPSSPTRSCAQNTS